MSKFRDTPPAEATAIPLPPTGLEAQEAELKRLEHEVMRFRGLAVREMLLRGSYRDLMKTLDMVEGMDPVPNDWRARLEGMDFLGGGFDPGEAD
ncbi:hypothetical protein ACN2C7_02150 [Caulobacter sp. ErkDOM-E]|uniref:hypothetical protein n=1 Tax=Caulobacter sp. ErkDOM-E TaxID=3402778 RepID=UPI003AF8FB4F